MFWNRKPKLPITPDDQIWVEESLSFLNESLGEENLLSIKTVTPTKEFFNRDFDHTEEDAHFIFIRCLELMNVNKEAVLLEFYTEENHYLDDGTILSTTADIQGRSQGVAGTYQKNNGVTTIRIEKEQLNHTENLIATISHELAHEKLLGEHRIIENNEYLTDLTAIAFGFGIFIANSKFQFISGKGNGFGWQMKSQGYLPEQVIAYAMASLALKREEKNITYLNHINPSIVTYINQSITYLKSDKNNTELNSFWVVKTGKIKKSSIEKNKVKHQEFTKSKIEELEKNLSIACLKEDMLNVESILKQGISPNCVYINGSPLAIAVLRNNVDLLELLLEYGAKVNYSESENMMDKLPLAVACEKENIAMINYLIGKGAEVNLVAGSGKSILEVAIKTGNLEVINCLLNKGASLEIKSGNSFLNFNKTPICEAVLNNDTKMVSFLVKNGAKTKPIRKLDRNKIHPKMVKFLKIKKHL